MKGYVSNAIVSEITLKKRKGSTLAVFQCHCTRFYQENSEGIRTSCYKPYLTDLKTSILNPQTV